MQISDLDIHFALGGGALGRLFGLNTGTVRAVDQVNIDVRTGEVLGVVGESGSGKTTLGRAMLGLVRPTSGKIVHRGTDLVSLSDRELRRRRRDIQMVFQDPHASLNPTMTIETAVGHPLRIHQVPGTRAEHRAKVVAALERVGLTPAERYLPMYPGDLSGGQKQRAVLARAIMLDPGMLVADEPVSMLDMSVRAKILQLMLDLKSELGLTYVYITHDLASAKFFCDRIAIMYLGRVVEIGDTAQIFTAPKHPYTQALLKAIPEPDPEVSVARDLPRGEIPDAALPPMGCSFHPRCPVAFERCGWEPRDLRAVLEAHWLTLDPEGYARESTVIGNLDELGKPGSTATLRPGKHNTAADIQALLDLLRAEQADQPFWRGVADVSSHGDHVVVEFRTGEDPPLRDVDGVDVACHLY